MRILKIISIIICMSMLNLGAFAQNNLGFYTGPTACKLFGGGDSNKHYFKPGGMISAFYDEKVDSLTYLRYGLEYQYQTAHLVTESSSPSSGSYRNADYRFQQLRLAIGYGIKVTPYKKVDTRILFGGFAGYNFRVHVKGNAWEYKPSSAIDTAGNEVSYSVYSSEEFDRFDNKAMSPFTFGAYIGWSTAFSLNERMSFLIQNEYYLGLGSKGGGLVTGVLGLGITYKL